MPELTALIPLVALLAVSGVVAGILAGLLGVGGGIVLVPVLEAALGFLGVDAAIRMHVAVGTSLGTIIPTAISSARSHHLKGAVDLPLARRWGPMLVLGAALGALTAGWVAGSALALFFGIVAVLVAAKMLFAPPERALRNSVPGGAAGAAVPLMIGGASSWMGIGGGTLAVPTLTLMGQAVHKAVGTSALFGLLIAVPGAIGFMWTGWGDVRTPPLSVGYVSALGVLILAPLTVLAAPLGVRLAHGFSPRQLSLVFGGFLLLVAVRMVYNGLVS